MKKTIITSLIALCGIGIASARIWTNAEGNKKFEAEYVSHTDTQVTVVINEQNAEFDISLLSAEDQTWIKNQSTPTTKPNTAPKTLLEKANPFLKKFDGQKYTHFKAEKEHEYYLLYFAASW